jgi:hypothetical protein
LALRDQAGQRIVAHHWPWTASSHVSLSNADGFEHRQQGVWAIGRYRDTGLIEIEVFFRVRRGLRLGPFSIKNRTAGYRVKYGPALFVPQNIAGSVQEGVDIAGGCGRHSPC